MLLDNDSDHSTYLPPSLDKALQEITSRSSSISPRQIARKHQEDQDNVSLQLSEISSNDISELTQPSGGSGLFTAYGCGGYLFDYSAGSQKMNLYQEDEDEEDKGQDQQIVVVDSDEDDDQTASAASVGHIKDLYGDDDDSEEEGEGDLRTTSLKYSGDCLYQDDDEEEEAYAGAATPQQASHQETLSLSTHSMTGSVMKKAPPIIVEEPQVQSHISGITSPSQDRFNLYEDDSSEEGSTAETSLKSSTTVNGEDELDDLISTDGTVQSTLSLPAMAAQSSSTHLINNKSNERSRSRSDGTATKSAADTFVNQILEEKKRVRAERLAKAKERIRIKNLEAAAQKQREKGPKAEDERLRLAFQWYSRCGMPSKAELKKRVTAMQTTQQQATNASCCDGSTLQDIDLLPWTIDGSRVNLQVSSKYFV